MTTLDVPLTEHQPVTTTANQLLRIKTLTELLAEPDETGGWLLPGCISDSVNLLYGPAGGSKSHFALEVALTLAGYDTALTRAGFDPVRPGLKVAIVAAEHGGQMEYRRRVARFGVNGCDNIYFVEKPPKNNTEQWIEELHAYDINLVIVDNFKAISRGTEVNESGQVGAVMQQYLDPIVDKGMALLLVHHTPKSNDTTPVGSQDFLGWSRWLLQLSNNGQALKAYGNEDVKRSYVLDYDIQSHRLKSVSEKSSRLDDDERRPERVEEARTRGIRDAEAIADALCCDGATTHYKYGTDAARKLQEHGSTKGVKALRDDIQRAAELLPQRFKVTYKTGRGRAWTLDVYPRPTG